MKDVVPPPQYPMSGSVRDFDSDDFLGDLDEFLDPAEQMEIEKLQLPVRLVVMMQQT